jgi:hypothetical protein
MLAAEMLGLKTGQLVFLYPTPGKGVKESTSPSDRATRKIEGPGHADKSHDVDRPTEVMLLMDRSHGWNAYEACFKFTHPDKAGNMKTRYYAGGALIYDSPRHCMENICLRTHWTFMTDFTEYGAKAPGENICWNPGPSPVDIWNYLPNI